MAWTESLVRTDTANPTRSRDVVITTEWVFFALLVAGLARLLIWSVVAISAFYAVVGLCALGFMSNGRVFADLTRSKVVTSTFVNQNHYVTFAGIGFISAAGLALQTYRRQLGRTGH